MPEPESKPQEPLRAPFPWFGGKRRVAHVVWERFGDVANYVEPFAGSLAVLLGRPHEARIETVNDLDCYLANFWRAVKWAPALVAEHARHRWLVEQGNFRERMKTDPDFYEPRVAGWWVWGLSMWIGSGWCAEPNWARCHAGHAAKGIHARRDRGNEVWEKRPRLDGLCGVAGEGPARKRPKMPKGSGTGVHRQLPNIAGADGAAGRGVHASGLPDRMPMLSAGSGNGVGVTRQIPVLKSQDGVHGRAQAIEYWMASLASRLRNVRVCCGDWKRVLGRSPTECIGTSAIFLDPPYSDGASRAADIYREDSLAVAHEVREWALANGENPKLRIALCGYEGEHVMPANWECVAWKANGGHGNASDGRGRANAHRERIWFSPHCLGPREPELFGQAPAEEGD